MAKKIIVQIESVTINLHVGDHVAQAPRLGLLGTLLAQSFSQPTSEPRTGNVGSTTGNSEATSSSAPVEAAPTSTAVSVSERILSFLNSDPRYTLRTLDAIKKQLADVVPYILDEVVTDLVEAGEVEIKHRRADGVTLYKAVVDSPAAATPVAAEVSAVKELSVAEVHAFLGSDDRYTQRTLQSIAKHFAPAFTIEAVQGALNDMVDDDDLQTRTRRRDGVKLYSVVY